MGPKDLKEKKKQIYLQTTYPWKPIAYLFVTQFFWNYANDELRKQVGDLIQSSSQRQLLDIIGAVLRPFRIQIMDIRS